MRKGERVEWACGVPDCSRRRHVGTVVDIISYAKVVKLGLTADPEPDQPYVAVAFDDRPAMLQLHPIGELVAVL